MTTEHLIIGIFCHVDNAIGHLPRHSQAKLYPSELWREMQETVTW